VGSDSSLTASREFGFELFVEEIFEAVSLGILTSFLCYSIKKDLWGVIREKKTRSEEKMDIQKERKNSKMSAISPVDK